MSFTAELLDTGQTDTHIRSAHLVGKLSFMTIKAKKKQMLINDVIGLWKNMTKEVLQSVSSCCNICKYITGVRQKKHTEEYC